MDYYQGVVGEYLKADRSLFINAECCIQLNQHKNPDGSGPHWYCDALAVCPKDKMVFLCEISYSKKLGSLRKRLASWNEHWPGLRTALFRDCGIPIEWLARPWLFVPHTEITGIVRALVTLPKLGDSSNQMPDARITPLEDVVPWNYCSWNREGEKDKPETIPEYMRI